MHFPFIAQHEDQKIGWNPKFQKDFGFGDEMWNWSYIFENLDFGLEAIIFSERRLDLLLRLILLLFFCRVWRFLVEDLRICCSIVVVQAPMSIVPLAFGSTLISFTPQFAFVLSYPKSLLVLKVFVCFIMVFCFECLNFLLAFHYSPQGLNLHLVIRPHV